MKKLKMRMHGENGKLITFCGLDGCGKSTMISLLTKELENNGYEVINTKQPSQVVRKSEMFRCFHDSDEHSGYSYRALALMASSDRIQHSNYEIAEELERGCVVLSDRYFYSCLANLRARGYVKDKWIFEISRDIPKPDMAFFLDLPTNLAISRVRARPDERDSYIDADFEERLRGEYIKICKKNSGVLVDSSRTAEETYSVIKNNLKQILDIK